MWTMTLPSSDKGPPFVTRRSWIIVWTLSLVAGLALWPIIGWKIAVSQTILGVPLWLACLSCAVKLRDRLGALWVVLLAPLLRQLLWVNLPAVGFSAFTADPRFEKLVTTVGLKDVSGAALLLTLSNYTLFAVLVALLCVFKLRLDISQCRASRAIGVFGLGLTAIWTVYRFYDQYYAMVLRGTERFGGSITYSWGYVGFTLLLCMMMPSPPALPNKLTTVKWFFAAAIFGGLMLGIGQRMFVLYPMMICMCLGLAVYSDRLRLRHLLITGTAGAAVVPVVFAMMLGVRRTYYFSGSLPNLMELPSLVAYGFGDMGYAVQEAGVRVSMLLFLTQTVVSAGSGLPTYGWQQVLFTFLDSLCSPRIFSFSALFGVSTEVQGLTPGAWLARLFGDPDSTMTFNPEAAFYLAGGPVGVVIGAVIVAVVACFWIFVAVRLQKNKAIGLAIAVGAVFTNLVLAELFNTVVSVFTWYMIVLIVLLKAGDLSFRAARRLAKAHPGLRKLPRAGVDLGNA